VEAAAQIVSEIRRSDYEGDRPALAREFEELSPFVGDLDMSSRIRYWRGFALWRRALNGFNDSADPTDLERDLRSAVSEFEAAAAADPEFVDANVGSVSCLFNIVFLHQEDPSKVRELLGKVLPLVRETERVAPTNPRRLWVKGANLWYAPPERGGGQSAAIDAYLQGLEASRRSVPSKGALEPTWGEPELLMSLAWASLHKTAPDVAAAERYARGALALVPYWRYVRDILEPEIQSAAKGPRR
jgi:hypothetical protein